MLYGYFISHQSIKTNIKTINNALRKVQQLQDVEYNDIKLGCCHIGLIAQENEPVIPEVITTNENEYLKSIAYSDSAALFIEAIKVHLEEVNFINN